MIGPSPGRVAVSIWAVIAASIAAALLITAGAPGAPLPAAATPPTLYATLDDVPVIGQEGKGIKLVFMLTTRGKRVTSLRAGTYSLVVDDQSKVMNFHLVGPGGADVRAVKPVAKHVMTGVESKGKVTFVVRLTRGTYTYYSDPHASSIRKTLRVF